MSMFKGPAYVRQGLDDLDKRITKLENEMDWTEHWINDLISQETIDNNTFDEWMWCPERYGEGHLNYMRKLWGARRENK